MIKHFIVVSLILISTTLCSAKDVPSTPGEWTIHAWVNPPHSNSCHLVWITSAGNLKAMTTRSSVDCGTTNCPIDKVALTDIFRTARLAITQFALDPTSIGRYRASQAASNWNMLMQLTVGDQEISVSDLRMKALTERPDFMVFLRLLNAQLPEAHRIDVEETAPSGESKGKHTRPDELR